MGPPDPRPAPEHRPALARPVTGPSWAAELSGLRDSGLGTCWGTWTGLTPRLGPQRHRSPCGDLGIGPGGPAGWRKQGPGDRRGENLSRDSVPCQIGAGPPPCLCVRAQTCIHTWSACAARGSDSPFRVQPSGPRWSSPFLGPRHHHIALLPLTLREPPGDASGTGSWPVSFCPGLCPAPSPTLGKVSVQRPPRCTHPDPGPTHISSSFWHLCRLGSSSMRL